MPRPQPRIVQDFILPALDSEKYSNKLYWINREEGIFRMLWSHKNGSKWRPEDTIVFQDWDRLKNRFEPEGKNYFMCSKQRFRSALYKLQVKQLECPEKFHRDYQLSVNVNKKTSENSVKSKRKSPKRTNQSLVPTSATGEKTSHIAQSTTEDREPTSLCLGIYTPSVEEVFAQYSRSMKKLHQSGRQYDNKSMEEIPQKRPMEVLETTVLRENSSSPRIPRPAPQPVPVFCSFKLFNSPHKSLQDFPEVFVSKIYNESENIPPMMDNSQNSVCTTDDDTSSGILNLSCEGRCQ